MLKKYVIDLERETSLQYLIGFLLLVVYAGTFFFPLMDKDAAHHANIALYMYEHNDFVSLIDRGNDYLDKPHFLFWSSLLSFELFGVNTFAHRLPGFLFSLLSIYSVYRLARHLSGKTTAKLAAVMLATAQAFILSIADARMETPLTAFIIFGIWQLVLYVDKQKFLNLLLASLGTAIAFSTKGWIGPVIVFVALFFYLLINRKWSVLLLPKTWLFIPMFLVFISPVLYAYYVQFDLHPEKVIRGKDHRSGVKFILWDQLFERSQGFDQGKKGRNSDYFFLYHTFLWAFFPWSLIAYAALFTWLRRMFYYKKWKHPFAFIVATFAFVLFAISFSKFKMPHYIIMLLPLAALFTAPYLRHILTTGKGIRFFLPVQVFCASIIFIAAIALNFYFFQPRHILVWIVGLLLLGILLLLIVKKFPSRNWKLLWIGVALSIVFNFLLYYDFFPNVLTYQGGNELAMQMKKENIQIPNDQILLVEAQAHSFDFYRKHNHAIIDPENFAAQYPYIKDKYFLLSTFMANHLIREGFTIQPVVSHVDYNVTTIKFNFLNPVTRQKTLDTLMLARVYKVSTN